MSKTFSELFNSEEKHKEAVYSEFDKRRKMASDAVKSSEEYINSGAYEDQASFTAYGDRAEKWRQRHEVEALLQKIYYRPYFAHIELKEKGFEESEHFYLSDSESLEQVMDIGKNGYLVPFKQDRERPITTALFHCYQAKNSKPVKYVTQSDEIVFLPQMICDDEIWNRELRNVMQLFPEQDGLSVDADELLEQLLQENRSNPTLRNIIATLQQQQFRIIETDVQRSFVVQGCAGSGKSQCLFHRLFFLRDILSEEGWEHVLLLTPTQLFRNYSADLIKRYQLSSINDCSIANLYQSLLNIYDARFRNRQYQFELSEEYLPDSYLKVVYSEETIRKIDSEIEKAIGNYVAAGCSALGILVLKKYDIDAISQLVKQLDIAIEAFKDREIVLQENPEYIKHRNEFESAQKRVDRIQNTIARLNQEKEQLIAEETQAQVLLDALEEANTERAEWLRQRNKRIEAAIKNIIRFDRLPSKHESIEAPAKYMKLLYKVRDLTEGSTFCEDEEYLAFLNNEYCAQAKKELEDKLGDETSGQYFARISKRKKVIDERISKNTDELKYETEIVSEHEDWIRKITSEYEGEKSSATLRRANMERARYFLSRIESSVFEQEVWKALSPQKELSKIRTLSIEDLETGRKRETRILYKSDLLFYVKIYFRLHGNEPLPNYTLLCIDEGQDLHQADYELLRKLFPNAAFNVFGDIEQALHVSCGIQNWQQETGIDNIFMLDRNYRNDAGIVEFCNRKLGSSMQYVGKPDKRRLPKEIHNIRELLPVLNEENITVIVKDRASYERLCKAIDDASLLEYLDTNSDQESKERIPCYSIFAAKGLEFSKVLVISDDMTQNQKIVACTRATERLYYYE